MRCSTVRAAIAAKVTSAARDTQAGPGDEFRLFDTGATLPVAMRERAFCVTLETAPHRATDLLPTDLYTAGFAVVVFYSSAQGVEDRIGDDAERISQKLETLPHAYADIAQVRVLGGPVQAAENVVTCAISVEVDYRLDTGV